MMSFLQLCRLFWVLARHRVLCPFPYGGWGVRLFCTITYLFIPACLDARKEPTGVRLAAALSSLGPSFIKLGQMLSTRSDLVGEEIASGLSHLQDKLPPFPIHQVEGCFQIELGKKTHEIFVEFQAEPVAAASIAQVHQATTQGGKKVAVKVLRPGIEKRFNRDLTFFYWIADCLDAQFPHMERLKLREVVDTLAQCTKLELDLRLEAAAASELKDNVKEDAILYIPEVEWAHTTRSILVSEWVEGISVYDTAALEAAGHDLKTLSEKLALCFFNQAYRDGFFHADMHPGNIMVNEAGQIVLVDFGIMGRLDKKTRWYVTEILRGFLSRDYHHVADVHFKAGYVPASQDLALFAQACRSIGEPIVGLSADNISIARLLMQLFTITEQFQMETQPQLLLLQKSLVIVEGVMTLLHPPVNMWMLAEEWAEEIAKKEMSLEGRCMRVAGEISAIVKEVPELAQGLKQLITMPPAPVVLPEKEVEPSLSQSEVLLLAGATSVLVTLTLHFLIG